MAFKLKETKEKFIVHKFSDNKYAVCKVLESYDTEEEALKSLLKTIKKKK